MFLNYVLSLYSNEKDCLCVVYGSISKPPPPRGGHKGRTMHFFRVFEFYA